MHFCFPAVHGALGPLVSPYPYHTASAAISFDH